MPPGSTFTATTGTSVRALSATSPGGAFIADGVAVNLGAGAVAAPDLIGAIYGLISFSGGLVNTT